MEQAGKDAWPISGATFILMHKAQAKPDLAEYADVLAATPLSVDAVRHTANLVYEYEARRQIEAWIAAGRITVNGELVSYASLPAASVPPGLTNGQPYYYKLFAQDTSGWTGGSSSKPSGVPP